jgi:pyruvate formate lyase activating enzyme
MHFGGIQRSSLIDYPGKVSCVLFLSGCNFNCPYCHNPGLVRKSRECSSFLKEDEIFKFLYERRGFLDGVVISGGEPTLQKDLSCLCEKIRKMGFSIKLDTNGSRPSHIKKLIERGLLDYIAMDIKTDPHCYDPLIEKGSNSVDLLSSINIIMGSGLDYEFRTTCVKRLINEQIIKVILGLIKNAKRYVLQLFNKTDVLHPEFFYEPDSFFNKNDLLHLKSLAEPWVRECIVR